MRRQAQGADRVAALNDQAVRLSGQGRYAEATVIAKQALQLSEKEDGAQNSRTLTCVNNLAFLYDAQGRYSEAEPLYKRALATQERLLGKTHPQTLVTVHNLAGLYVNQGRYSDAEPLMKHNLQMRERVLGKDHLDTLMSGHNLASLYKRQGRYGEAEALVKRVFEARERLLGKNHPDTLLSANNLAGLLEDQGRYGDAEPLMKRVLEAEERVLGKGHPQTLVTANNLAGLYGMLERYGDAELLLKRVLEASERSLGKDHPETLLTANNLAWLYGQQARYGDAEQLRKRVLEAQERSLGKNHPNTLISLNNLASLYTDQRRYGDAEPLYKRVLEARERLLGRDHPETLISANNLAYLYENQGRYSEAEPLYKRALEVQERVLGSEHPSTILSLSNLAFLYFEQGDWGRATQFSRRSASAIVKRGGLEGAQALAGKNKGEVGRSSIQFVFLVKAMARLVPESGEADPAATREMFQSAQWALGSEAAQSLAQMAARGATGNPALAILVRERQDLVVEWQQRDSSRNTAVAQSAEKRDAKAEAVNLSRLAAIENLIAGIDKRLKSDFPDYAALASPAPLTVEEVQGELRADEALVLFLDTLDMKSTPEETFVWVVTKTDIRLARSDFGMLALYREVAALRCGLDAVAWNDPAGCNALTKAEPIRNRDGDIVKLPFDLARAHALYKALLGKVEDLIKDKRHLLLVPSGALTQFPFQALVTAPAENAESKSAAWLIRDHALTVLPAVSSLKALRRVSRPGTAPKPMIGFGNPLLDGPSEAYANDAKLAREKQRCPESMGPVVASLSGLPRSVSQLQMRAPLPMPPLCASSRRCRRQRTSFAPSRAMWARPQAKSTSASARPSAR